MAARSPAKAAAAVTGATREEVEAAEDASADVRIQETVLGRTIPWHDFRDNKFITDKHCGLLEQYSVASRSDQDDFLSDTGPAFGECFVRALSTIGDKSTQEYLLTLVHDLLTRTIEETSTRATYFNNLELKERYHPFLTILSRYSSSMAAVSPSSSSSSSADNYSMLRAASILGVLLGEAGPRVDRDVVQSFARWIIATLAPAGMSERFSQHDLLRLLESVKMFLKNGVSQSTFAVEGGLKCFDRHFSSATKSFQLQYVSGFSIWLLTFSREDVVEAELKRFDIIQHVSGIIQNQQKEKVQRMCFNILINLLRMRSSTEFLEQLVGFDSAKTFTALAAKKYKDTDIPKDINFVVNLLNRKIAELSSFEMYVTELNSRHLRWTPVHTEQFWSEHKNKFEEKGFDLIQKLVDLLDSTDDLTVEVACYDLGEFARFHAEGKRVVSKLGKTRLMLRMASTNAKIAKQALLGVQKLMVQNWEFLQKK